MNKNKVIGLVLIALAVALACLFASVRADVAEGIFGKALWYLPYVAAVCGVRRLAKCRGLRRLGRGRSPRF